MIVGMCPTWNQLQPLHNVFVRLCFALLSFGRKVAVNKTMKLLVIMTFLILFAAVLRIGQGISQCYDTTDCTGSIVRAFTPSGCCVATNDGLSFRSDGFSVCRTCIGEFFWRVWLVKFLLLQFMGLGIQGIVCKRVRHSISFSNLM